MRNEELYPDVERPDEYEPVGDEIYCWLPGNYDRECNGSCVAFDMIFEEDQRRSSCMLINMCKSAVLSVAKIANMAQDKARAAAVPNQPPPRVS